MDPDQTAPWFHSVCNIGYQIRYVRNKQLRTLLARHRLNLLGGKLKVSEGPPGQSKIPENNFVHVFLKVSHVQFVYCKLINK